MSIQYLKKGLASWTMALVLVGAANAQSSTGPLEVDDQSIDPAAEKKADKDQATTEGGNDQAVNMLMDELQQYRSETRELRGMVEQLRHKLDTMKKAQRERYLDLDTRINTLAEASAGQQKSDSGEDSSEQSPEQESTSGEQSTAESQEADREAYMAARDHLLQRDFKAARDAFQQYLKDYPEGHFQPFAHFWLGEVYRNMSGKRAQASKQFSIVIDDYPDHSKVPAALYKLAVLQAKADKTGQAQVNLQKLRKRFPESSEADLAKQMLQQLDTD